MERHIDDRAPHRCGRGGRRVLATVGAVLAVGLLVSGCVINGAWAALPAPLEVGDGIIYDVACTAPDDCLAVGEAFDGSGAIVRSWDGATWDDAPAPTGDRISVVDCGATDRCAGIVRGSSIVGPDLFTVWDGAGWTTVPPGATVIDARSPFSCAPDGSCVFVIADRGQTVTWDGTSFTSIPFTAGGDGDPDAWVVDCRSASACTSIGQFGAVTRWDGSVWTRSDEYVDVMPKALACPAADRCVVVGEDADGGAMGTWDGATWSVEPVPGGNPSAIVDVSCASEFECLAVGDPAQGSPAVGEPVELAWNGADWYVVPAAPGGATASYAAVSCVPRWCLASGYVPPTDLGPFEFVASSYAWTNP